MRARLHEAMEELGYRPLRAGAGRAGRPFTIGVVVSDIENPFLSIITDGISSVIRTLSYELFVSPNGFEALPQKAVFDAIIDHQMDGLVLVAPPLTVAEVE